ncbi:nucleoside hydrolase [Catalinimonas niigatensis]|uniref:nucleoside hydrolase n=1 Tax=Catalinimonas niigatensis TaxID=1397264 RepID=UPI002666727F|nr:nucleoside hydrolase [Catalinimonas niigatensis]WPP52676.1 nucleoside hydrolase [Catalinimonas niigatensis]
MKLLPYLFFVFYSFLSLAQPTKIIFDTDMESDVDDIGALAMLHGLADAGAAEILATMVCSLNPWSVPTVDAVNTYCGRPDIPIGAVKTLGVYRNSNYAKIISEEFPQDSGLGEAAEDAIKVYRQLLAAEEDSSVVIVTVGYLTNLAYLLSSYPDEISELSGSELVRKKVKRLVCMGDRYPFQQDIGKWGNFRPDPGAVVYVSRDWPTDIIYTGGGDFANLIPSGEKTFDFPPASNPISRAYAVFLKSWNRNYHHSADLIAVYVAVKGWEEYFELHSQGYNHIFEDATHMWRLQPNDPRHHYIDNLLEGVNPEDVTEVFDELMVTPIRAKMTKE